MQKFVPSACARWVFAICLCFGIGSESLCIAGSQKEIPVAGGAISLELKGDTSAELEATATEWIERAARAVTIYYGAFPVQTVRLRVNVGGGRGARNGHTYGWNGRLITIGLGRDSTTADLADDWLMTHEMLHLGFPSVPEAQHWIEEGLATYIEPIARARAGFLSPGRAWHDLVDGLPQGEPEPGDRGLDVTHTWGRTYWGGALFCLKADVEIRRRTNNRRGLEHTLRAIVAAGGTVEADWPIDRVLEVGDRATGVPVLRELYEQMRAKPITVDLDQLWQQLGIESRGRTIVFHDDAPLARIRQAITANAKN